MKLASFLQIPPTRPGQPHLGSFFQIPGTHTPVAKLRGLFFQISSSRNPSSRVRHPFASAAQNWLRSVYRLPKIGFVFSNRTLQADRQAFGFVFSNSDSPTRPFQLRPLFASASQNCFEASNRRPTAPAHNWLRTVFPPSAAGIL